MAEDVYVGSQEIPCEFDPCPFGLEKPHNFSDHPFLPHSDRGIYPKYVVFKHPGREVEFVEARTSDYQYLTEVDDFCFVLKPIKDKHARIAMAAYAESVKEEKPQLAADLYEVLGDF